ncbi:putative topless-related protein 1 isoform X1 [Iris pallida]|uniref:Topless-related protein 1 isoform X1 n=1 Tax=Iris pallida TaxID=29817 RepID=A0AAX6EVR9_IRIPA|nr:putative topless-related protein 1 isoform X1 [Iris pallida]
MVHCGALQRDYSTPNFGKLQGHKISKGNNACRAKEAARGKPTISIQIVVSQPQRFKVAYSHQSKLFVAWIGLLALIYSYNSNRPAIAPEERPWRCSSLEAPSKN